MPTLIQLAKSKAVLFSTALRFVTNKALAEK